MKLVHTLPTHNIPDIIEMISMNEFISDSGKRILFRELDHISDIIEASGKEDELDITDLPKLINLQLSTSDFEVVENAFFTKLPRISEVETETLSIEESIEIPEEKNINDKLPIFFIFNGGNNILSRTIMLFTQADFSHVSISTDGLSEIVSFATTSQNYGLVVENWFDFNHIRKPKNIAVHFIDVPVAEYAKIKRTIEYHKAHSNEYYYSFKKLFTAPFRSLFKPAEEKKGFICSEFVYYLCAGTSIADAMHKDNSWFITPSDFREKILQESTAIFSGKITDFEPKIVKNVFKLYTDGVLAEKKSIDSKAKEMYKEDLTDEAKIQLKNFKLTLNK